MKIGVFIPNWIGDVAMCTPTLRALRRHFGPQATILGILQPYVSEVLAGTPWLDEQIFYHAKSKVPAEQSRGVLDQLRAHKVDTVVLLTNSLRAAVIAWLSGARVRVGYARNGRGALLTHKLYHPRLGRDWLPTPAIDVYLQLAYAVGCELESPAIELATTDADERAADVVWEKFKLPSDRQVVVLNSGGAYGAAKLWPSEHFAKLARRIVEQQGLPVLVTCGPAERETARAIVEKARHPQVYSLADEPVSIGLTKACIRRGRVLVSTDSGPRFFGVAFGVPVVSLFGPTAERWSHTHDSREICMHQAVPCGPCGQRTCPLGHHDCMVRLDVDRVYAAVTRQLDVARRAAAA